MRRSPADSTNRSLAAFGKLQHILNYSSCRFTVFRLLDFHFLFVDGYLDRGLSVTLVRLRRPAAASCTSALSLSMLSSQLLYRATIAKL